MINNLFTESTKATRSTKRLSGTAEMTARADAVVNKIIETLNNDFDSYAELFEASKTDAYKMDELINVCTNNLEDTNVDFLEAFDEQCIAQMLKSQSSKRSRAKSKEMTMDNWESMMNAAICEAMIRKYTGKAKGYRGHGGTRHGTDYTPEVLERLKSDQDEIRRELRNIQSKQCMLRKKHPDDYEELEAYQKLEEVAQELKDARQPVEGTRVRMADVTSKLDVDIAALNLEEAQAIIAELKTMTGGNK